MPPPNDDIPKERLTQPEREAIVDLLHLCLYGDSHIALRESEFLASLIDAIGWETQRSYESYEARSVARARAADESSSSRREFLSFASERLQTPESRALALELCGRLFASDGTTGAAEAALLGEIREALR